MDKVAKVDRPELVHRPTDAYLASAQQLSALFQVQIAAQNACLAQNGVSGAVAASGAQSVEEFAQTLRDDMVIRSSLWGFFDVEGARSKGYQRPLQQNGEPPLQLNNPADTPQEVARTCREAGTDALGGKDWAAFPSPSVLPAGGPPSAAGDSRWREAQAEWSSCMKEKGFSFESPIDAIGDPAWQGGSVTAEQISAAVADVDCKISTNLVGIGVAVQSAYDQRYIDEHRAELDAFVADRDSYLRG